MSISVTKSLAKYTIFISACFGVVWIFVTATTFIQLAAGMLIYLVVVLFAYKLFSHKMLSNTSKRPSNAIIARVKPVEKAEAEDDRSSIGISDIDKRVFLKLIGGTGLTLFLFSLFNKKTEDLLYKGLSGQGLSDLTDVAGNKTAKAQNQPLDGYRIAEVEDEIISFYGFVNKFGEWYVLRVDTVAGSFRYARGKNDFPDAWGSRENLEYGYFNDVFNR